MVAIPIGLISNLRNKRDTESSWQEFQKFVSENLEQILQEFSIRWLVSICDTYADYGNPVQSRNALLISNFINMLRLAETTYFVSGSLRQGMAEKTRMKPIFLFDGIHTIAIDRQDVLLNLAKRMHKTLEDDDKFSLIWDEILRRLRKSECMITRFRDMSAMPERYFSENAINLPDNYGIV